MEAGQQQRADHIFTDPLGLPLGLSPDSAMHIETCVAPTEDLLHQREADELFPEQKREDPVGKVDTEKNIQTTIVV